MKYCHATIWLAGVLIQWKHTGQLVPLWLDLEQLPARHRHHPSASTTSPEGLRYFNTNLNLRTCQ